MKKALLVKGGWDGHQPNEVTEVFEGMLKDEGFDTKVSDSLEALRDLEYLRTLDLIVPTWTMGSIERELVQNVMEAVAGGVGIAGCHGGMCDAFRESTEWQFMTGGQWVSHPGGDDVEYMVNIRNSSSGITYGIDDFMVKSEQYYLHVDPCIEVLATTRFPTVRWYHSSNREVDVPVIWTKMWGHGRVFYTSLGHHADVFDIPEAYVTMKRGMLWAAEGKVVAVENNLSADDFASDKKMF
ncbi:MAG: ThuA domain-containing protein [Clostridia bacterium]|nr:ThuA domain-containing protein [Clostridia bacterium]